MASIKDEPLPVRLVGRVLDCYLRCSLGSHVVGLVPAPRRGGSRAAIDRITEAYVLFYTFGAIAIYVATLFMAPSTEFTEVILAAAVLGIGAHRILEIVCFQLNMLLQRSGSPGGVASVASYPRSFLLMVANYLETTIWFAAAYSIMVRWGALSAVNPRGLSILRESLSMMLVNTTGAFAPTASIVLWIIFVFHAGVGLFMTLFVAARTIAMIPIPPLDPAARRRRSRRS